MGKYCDMTIHERHWPLLLLSALLLAAFITTQAAASEIRVLSANGLSIPARELAPAFTAQTGHRITFTFGSPGDVNNRLAAGETYDLVFLPTEAARQREAAGAWLPGTRTPLARLGIGVAVRTGATLDLSTVESARAAFLAARSIALSDGATGGLSRPNAEKVLANLGILEAVKSKLIYARDGQELVGKGEAEIGLFNVSEIPRADGVALAGPIPSAAQVYIVYDTAVPRANPAPDAALAFVAFLSRPSTKAAWEKAGLGLFDR